MRRDEPPDKQRQRKQQEQPGISERQHGASLSSRPSSSLVLGGSRIETRTRDENEARRIRAKQADLVNGPTEIEDDEERRWPSWLFGF